MQNTTNIKLEIKKYPKMIELFAKENFNLKSLLFFLLLLLLVNSLTTIYLVKRGPEVVALDSMGAVAKVETKITDLQIQEAAKEYVSARYSWTKDNVVLQLKKAEFFVLPSLVPSYRKSMLDVQKFVLEKKVTQRIYPKNISVDLKNSEIRMTLDRITEFDQLKAATEMKLTLGFMIESRTPINPWGVYITKESEKVAE